MAKVVLIGGGVNGSKMFVVTFLAPLGVTERSGRAKSALVGAGRDLWGVLKVEPEELKGPPGVLSGEDIGSSFPMLAIAIPMI
jgi:hypothetical protein